MIRGMAGAGLPEQACKGQGGLWSSTALVVVVFGLQLLAGTLQGCLGVSALSHSKPGTLCRARCS